MNKKLFKNALIVDAEKKEKGDILVSDGKIIKIHENIEDENAQIIDVKGRVLMPAFIDMHCHFRDPGLTYKEDIETGLKAALKGGYGTVCAMANTKPICDNVEVLEYTTKKAKELNLCRYIQVSAIGVGLEDKNFVQINNNIKYTRLFSNDGKTIFSANFMKKALEKSREYNFHILTHCDPEHEVIKRDVKLAGKTKGNLHVCHISEKKSLEYIEQAKKDGVKVTCEVTPHHLFAHSMEYKVNPPFATKEDREYLISGIKRGTIDVLATDHAPHSKEDKENGAPGIDNIEVAFSVYNKVFYDNGINLNKLSEMISKNPARIIGLNKGLVKVGYDADFTIVDDNYKGVINKDEFISKSNNTPFDKKEIRGKVLMTFVKGEKKYDAYR